jgi:hypothetical protein
VAVLVRDFGPINVEASILSVEGDVISLIIKFRLDEHFAIASSRRGLVMCRSKSWDHTKGRRRQPRKDHQVAAVHGNGEFRLADRMLTAVKAAETRFEPMN